LTVYHPCVCTPDIPAAAAAAAAAGNHPFYQGNSSILVVDEGQLNKFKKRFGGLEEFAEIGAAAGSSGPATEDEGMKRIGGKAKATKKKRR
jgi:large subunit ribosomal protein L31